MEFIEYLCYLPSPMISLEELAQRGLIQDLSDKDGISKLTSQHSFYVGFDPTAPSLHVGNLVQIIVALHLTKLGLKPIILFGGATGFIGDPKKTSERPTLEAHEIEANVQKQIAQMKSIWERSQLPSPMIVNNYDWTKEVSVLDFLRDIGKHIPVNYMLQKETVKLRLEGVGISYTEFSYMLLQAFDFLHLYKNHNCKLQVGGSDQWGNMTAGTELIRRRIQGEGYVLSTPLITDSQGNKFGKSEGNAVWLDGGMTSPYHFYQFWLNTQDADVVKLLKYFSFLPLQHIAQLEESVKKTPEARDAQRALAASVTELVHGMAGARRAEDAAKALFNGDLSSLSVEELLTLFKDAPTTRHTLSELESLDFVTLISKTVAPSKGEARRLLSSGGIYVNNERTSDDSLKPASMILAGKNLIVLRSGKKNYHLIHVAG